MKCQAIHSDATHCLAPLLENEDGHSLVRASSSAERLISVCLFCTRRQSSVGPQPGAVERDLPSPLGRGGASVHGNAKARSGAQGTRLWARVGQEPRRHPQASTWVGATRDSAGWRLIALPALPVAALAAIRALDVSGLLWAWQLIHSSISLSTQPTIQPNGVIGRGGNFPAALYQKHDAVLPRVNVFCPNNTHPNPPSIAGAFPTDRPDGLAQCHYRPHAPAPFRQCDSHARSVRRPNP
jgi:hypothetical protein